MSKIIIEESFRRIALKHLFNNLQVWNETQVQDAIDGIISEASEFTSAKEASQKLRKAVSKAISKHSNVLDTDTLYADEEYTIIDSCSFKDLEKEILSIVEPDNSEALRLLDITMRGVALSALCNDGMVNQEPLLDQLSEIKDLLQGGEGDQ